MKDKQVDLFGEIVNDEDISNREWNKLSDSEKKEIKKRCEYRDTEAKKLAEQKREDLKSGKQSTVDLLFEM
jgi:predicted Fe-S protein YdhL (DUF1289 family)